MIFGFLNVMCWIYASILGLFGIRARGPYTPLEPDDDSDWNRVVGDFFTVWLSGMVLWYMSLTGTSWYFGTGPEWTFRGWLISSKLWSAMPSWNSLPDHSQRSSDFWTTLTVYSEVLIGTQLRIVNCFGTEKRGRYFTAVVLRLLSEGHVRWGPEHSQELLPTPLLSSLSCLGGRCLEERKVVRKLVYWCIYLRNSSNRLPLYTQKDKNT